MKRKFETLIIILALLALAPSLPAAEIEKEPLSLEEITHLLVKEQSDRTQIERTEAGLHDGAGLFAFGVIAVIVLVVVNSY